MELSEILFWRPLGKQRYQCFPWPCFLLSVLFYTLFFSCQPDYSLCVQVWKCFMYRSGLAVGQNVFKINGRKSKIVLPLTMNLYEGRNLYRVEVVNFVHSHRVEDCPSSCSWERFCEHAVPTIPDILPSTYDVNLYGSNYASPSAGTLRDVWIMNNCHCTSRFTLSHRKSPTILTIGLSLRCWRVLWHAAASMLSETNNH